MFYDLRYKISHFAIKKCWDQYKLLQDDDFKPKECSGTFMAGWGIPCHHRLQEMMEDEVRGLQTSDFHVQWHLDYYPEGGNNLVGLGGFFLIKLLKLIKGYI